jgi:hypothetical protein
MPRRRFTRRIADLALIVLFLALLALPTARSLVIRPASVATTEKRTLAKMPEFHLQRRYLDHFAVQFEAFYNDHFGFRDFLIRCLHNVQLCWVGISSSPKVIVGKNGWLFYTDVPFDCDRATRPYTPEQLAAWQNLLEARRDWLRERGIRFLFVVAPDKQTIYPEYLPRTLSVGQVHETRLNQLMAHLRRHSDLPVVDLRGPLREAKARERLYNRSDSHWNGRGAFVAYQTIVEALAPWFDRVRPLPRAAFREETVAGPSGDCATLLSMQDRIREEELQLRPLAASHTRLIAPSPARPVSPIEPLVILEQDEPKLPRAVVFRDSFGAALVPFLSEHFRRTVFVWQDYPTFDSDTLEKERPDVVIQEIVERKLAYPDMVDPDPRLPEPRQQVAHYLSSRNWTWLTCLHGE